MGDIKRALLRVGIADVPLSWDELIAIADGDTSGRSAFNFLARPASWHQMPAMFGWYSDRFENAASSADTAVMFGLLRAASLGAGTSVDHRARRRLLANLLVTAILAAPNRDAVPALVLASRYACREIHPAADFDVLPDAAAALFEAHTAVMEPSQAAQAVVVLFDECERTDRLAVLSAVLNSRVEPHQSVLPAPISRGPRPVRTRTAAPRIADAHRAAGALTGIGARQVLLFGSVAHGHPGTKSDLDLVAIFDDLGDYSTRRSLEYRALAAVEDACDWDCDILVTDRVEWSVRSKLATTVEAEIAQSCRMVLDLPVAGPIDWNKNIGWPASDTQEALAELRVAGRHVSAVCEYARGTHAERDAQQERDTARIETARRDRMRMLCESSHSAASAALRAYTKGVLRQRPSRGGGKGRFAAMLAEIPEDKRAGFEAVMRVSPSGVDAWEQRPGSSLPSELLESVTPLLAADMAETAIGFCRLAACSIDDALGPAQEARDLLEAVSAGGIAEAVEAIRRGAPSRPRPTLMKCPSTT